MSILRIAKYLFLFIVAVALVLMALANRETVVVEMVPEALVGWFGIQYAIALPLFLVKVKLLIQPVLQVIATMRRSPERDREETDEGVDRSVVSDDFPTSCL